MLRAELCELSMPEPDAFVQMHGDLHFLESTSLPNGIATRQIAPIPIRVGAWRRQKLAGKNFTFTRNAPTQVGPEKHWNHASRALGGGWLCCMGLSNFLFLL